MSKLGATHGSVKRPASGAAIDSALRTIRLLRRLRFLGQVLLLLLAVFLFGRLLAGLGGHYLVEVPWFAWVAPGSILVLLFARSLRLVLQQTEKRVAVELDDRLGLKNRLGTYLELRDTDHPFVEALGRDASGRIRPINRLRASRPGDCSGAAVLLVLLLALVLPLLPFLPVPARTRAKAREREQVRHAARELHRAAADRLPKEKARRPELKQLLDEFEKVAREIEKPSTEKTDAITQIDSLQAQSERAARALAEANQRALEQKLGRRLSPMDLNRLAEEAEKASAESGPAEDGSSSSGEKQARSAEMKKALEQYRKDGQASADEIASLERSLSDARKQLLPAQHRVTTNSRLTDRQVQKGKGGVDDGPGTTNQDVGPSTFDTKKKGESEYIEDRTKAEYEKLYQGQRENAGKEAFYLPSLVDPSKAKYARVRIFGSDSRIESKDIPAGKTEQDLDQSAIRKERIPANYRRLIQQYFESVEKQ